MFTLKSAAIESIISDFIGKALECFSPPASLLTVYDLLCKDYGTFTLDVALNSVNVRSSIKNRKAVVASTVLKLLPVQEYYKT